VGALPALASGPVAHQAVAGLATLVVAGRALPLRLVGRAGLFPSIVNDPHDFVVLDYDTLFAALNADQPGTVVPTEAWSFAGSRRPPRALDAATAETRLRDDPLAAGTRKVLTVAGVLAAVLGFVGLVLATRSALASERLVLAEYEALGVAPHALRRAAQLRVFVVSGIGLVAGVLGGIFGVLLVSAFVAVTGTAGRPLPPIVAVVAWPAAAGVLAALVAATFAAAAFVSGRALREPPAARLRA
jgi:ABC-type antimicrobial peptide transport system permease subunit